jgi:hypothetical protein
MWNCDETGKNFEHQPVKVIAANGEKSVVGRTSASSSNITIMAEKTISLQNAGHFQRETLNKQC